MGLFDSSSTTSSQYSRPATTLQNQVYAGASKGMAPWLSDPTYNVAPMNNWQTTEGNSALGMLGQGSGGSYAGQMAGLLGDNSGAINAAGMFSSVSPSDIQSYAGPLEQMMNDAGMKSINKGVDQAQTDIGARAAAGGAFGGSREAVQRGMLDQNRLDAINNMTGSNEASAYQLGSSIAGQNANAANARNTNLANTILSANGQNLGALSQADASRLNGLTADQQILGLLGSYGDTKQQYDQRVLDAPYTQASRFQGYVPGAVANTTTSNNPSMVQSIGSLLSSFL